MRTNTAMEEDTLEKEWKHLFLPPPPIPPLLLPFFVPFALVVPVVVVFSCSMSARVGVGSLFFRVRRLLCSRCLVSWYSRALMWMHHHGEVSRRDVQVHDSRFGSVMMGFFGDLFLCN